MTLLLAIETTGPACDCALCDGIIPIWQERVETATVTEVLPAVAARAVAAALERQQPIGAVAADLGPGSFSGTRSGVAFAAAFARARSLPAYGVTSVDLLRWGLPPDVRRVCAVLDARRGELYAALYDGLQVAAPGKLWAPEALARELAGEWLLVGSGAGILAALLPSARRAPAGADEPRAATLTVYLAAHPGPAPTLLEPRYVRGAVG